MDRVKRTVEHARAHQSRPIRGFLSFLRYRTNFRRSPGPLGVRRGSQLFRLLRAPTPGTFTHAQLDQLARR